MDSESEIKQCNICGEDLIIKEAVKLVVDSTMATLYICRSCVKDNPEIFNLFISQKRPD